MKKQHAKFCFNCLQSKHFMKISFKMCECKHYILLYSRQKNTNFLQQSWSKKNNWAKDTISISIYVTNVAIYSLSNKYVVLLIGIVYMRGN